MITCPSCGTSNPEAARFCMSCAQPLTTGEAQGREARKVVTVVFADVTGSTGLGEHLDPESVRSIMGRWFEALRDVIEQHGGTVEKFIGDAVVAVFGVPAVHEDDALRAVRAAIGMQAALERLNGALRRERGLEIQMRVGVNTGEVVVGDARAGGSRATGDAVNVAARLQQAAEPGEILVGDSTWRLVREAVTTGEPREVQVKGRQEPVTVRRLEGVDQTAEAIHRRVGGPMVGRERELGILRAAYERGVAESRCVLVTVLGTAGVGKSRLTHEFLAGIRAGATVVRGRCLPYGQGITWYPIAELLRSAVELDDEAEPGEVVARLRARLEGDPDAATVVARLAEPLGIAAEPAPVEELFWAVRRFLERLATEAPTVVVLDDIHWADATVLDLIEHLADWVHALPLLLIGLARPELLDVRQGWGGGKPDATTFLLEPLPAEQTGELVDALFEGARVPEAARNRIAAAADGNPLFAEQVIEMLLDDGVVHRQPDGTLQVDALEALDAIAMPPTIQALLAARLDRLNDQERRTIERASVVGKEFAQREVSELTPADNRPSVPGQLMALVRKELIRPERRRNDGGESFRFRHLLIRDAAYDSLPKAERADLHERFADWLEASAGDRLAERDEIVGYHLAQARTYRLALGPDDQRTRALALRAGRRLLAAGRRAVNRDDLDPAERLLREAAGLLVEDREARYGALLDLIDVAGGRDYPTAVAVADEAEAVGREIGDHAALRAKLWTWVARSYMEPSFQFEALRPQVEAAVETFRGTDDLAALLDALEVLSIVDLNAAHWGNAGATARIGMDLAIEHGLENRRSTFARWLSNALIWGSTHASEGLLVFDELLTAEGRRSARGALFAGMSVLKAIVGDAEGAMAADAEASAISLDLGRRPNKFRLTFALYALDDVPAALEASRDETAFLERVGETGQRSTMLSIQGWFLALLGDNEEALRAAEAGRAVGSKDDAVTQILWRNGASLANLQLGNLAEADRLSSEVVEIASRTDSLSASDSWEVRARVLAALGRDEEMHQAAARARELYVEKGALAFIRRIDGFLSAARR